MPDFAKILRSVRKHCHLSQEQAAEIFSLSLSTLQRIEAGKRDLTYTELERIAEFCRKDIREILQLADDQQAQKANPEEKEKRWEKIIAAQNDQITSLLEEIKNLYGVVEKVISGEGEGRNDTVSTKD